MSMTPYTGETLTIANIGTTPQERAMETSEFKMAFSKDFHEFVEWFNNTHNGEINEHMAENMSYQVFVTRDISLGGEQTIALIAGRTPKQVIILANVGFSKLISIGIVSQNAQGAIGILGDGKSTGTYNAIILGESAANYTEGAVTLESGQIKINWAKTGLPTGIAQLFVTAIYHD